MKKSPLFLSLFPFLVAVFFVACGGRTDRDLILELLDRVKELVDKKDVEGLMVLVDEDYLDFEGRGKKETEEMIQDYFKEYIGIVLHILSTEFEEIKDFEISLETEVVLSSGAAEVFRKLVRFAGNFYRFQLKLRKKGNEWQVFYARWQEIGMGDLFPESFSLLKKIFPDI